MKCAINLLWISLLCLCGFLETGKVFLDLSFSVVIRGVVVRWVCCTGTWVKYSLTLVFCCGSGFAGCVFAGG